MNLKDIDIVSIRDLDRSQIDHILDLAEKMIPFATGERMTRCLEGKVLANLFFEPSTRTKLSFESAAARLGIRVLEVSSATTTSMSKGETLSDTIRTVESYSDIIVLRHPHEGSSRLAAHFSSKPVINAGDGAGQHPTQTLLDLFTIRSEKGGIEGMKVVMVGDLKYGRTAHSLAVALSMFGAELTFVAPETLQMPTDTVDQVSEVGHAPRLTSDLESVISEADVLYVTRIQRERFPDPEEYNKVAGTYRIDKTLLREARKDLIVLHPLPRVDEIAPEVDYTDHAKYFRQAFNGVPMRMAILMALLGGELD